MILSFYVILWIALIGFTAPAGAVEALSAQKEQTPLSISQVAVNRGHFDPGRGETVVISYALSRPAKAVVKIFDPEMQLVRDLVSESRGESQIHTIVWDGKDAQGRTVPDEAYFFTIEAVDYHGNTAFYDPATFSGGRAVTPDEVRFDREQQRVLYRIPEASRVKIRAGISAGGPLLKNILYGLPRAAGEHEASWDGKDESGRIDVTVQKGYQLTVEATTLFENSVIARGNSEYDFFHYRRDIAFERPGKVERPLRGRELAWMGLPRPEPIRMTPEPKFRIELPDAELKFQTGAPLFAGKLPIRIYLDEAIKKHITEQRYEIIFFVDFRFVTEKEEGYSPFTLIWDTSGTPDGEHIVTINVATFSGEVSSGSAAVTVRNER